MDDKLAITTLTESEADDLEQLEQKINRSIKAAGRIAGEALAEIRDRRLYRSTHASFEAYVLDRCGFSKTTAYRMIEVARPKALPKPQTSQDGTRLPGKTHARSPVRPIPEPEPEADKIARQSAAAKRQRRAGAEVAAEQVPPAVNLMGDRIACPRCKGTGTLPRPAPVGRRPHREPDEGPCAHPIGRRIGDGCGACGKVKV